MNSTLATYSIKLWPGHLQQRNVFLLRNRQRFFDALVVVNLVGKVKRKRWDTSSKRFNNAVAASNNVGFI
jgi:hypothetical protein